MSLWLVFAVTFVIFPGTFFLSHFNFMHNNKSEFVWYAQLMILGFNALDTVGRKAGGMVNPSPGMCYFLSLMRIVFLFTTIYIAKLELS
jgi:hypothetical protein